MNLSAVISVVSQDKNLDKNIIINALEQAMLHITQKDLGLDSELEVSYNEETDEIDVFQFRTVVENVTDKQLEMTLEEAKKLDPDSETGDSIGVKLDTSKFGRISAQAAKQIILQKINEAERIRVYNNFKDKKGEVVSGYVRRLERKSIVMDLGQVEAYIPHREQIFGEKFRIKDRIQGYVVDVSQSLKGPQIIISRACNDFLIKLFEQNITEIYDEVVEIVSVARDPGQRSKVSVYSKDSNVDPVGACVGMKGARIQAIVDELNGEKIDIVPWDNDPAVFVCNALSPAVVNKVIVDEDNQSMEIVVSEDQLSLTIGKKGQNVRLAAQLTGWKLDIKSEQRLKKQMESAKSLFNSIENLGEMHVTILMNEGIKSPQDLVEISPRALTRLLNLQDNQAEKIIDDVKNRMIELKDSDEQKALDDLHKDTSHKESSASADSELSITELAKQQKDDRIEVFLKLGGVGEATADALADSGYATVGDLIADSTDEMALKTSLPLAVIKTVQNAADKYMQSQLSKQMQLKDKQADNLEDNEDQTPTGAQE